MTTTSFTALRGPPSRRRQLGLTLVELMVGLVISIVVSLAAAALYLATRESTRAAQGHSDINETGKIALDMIGRELQKAGFYPAQFTTPADLSRAGKYYNGKSGGFATFDNGLFGCDSHQYDQATHICSTATTTATTKGDAVIVNYFSSPEFGAGSLIGNSNDCNRQPVSGDTDNTTKAAAGLPLFVSNRFMLVSSTYTSGDGKSISTYSLACQGNGVDAGAAQPAIQGVEELYIRYGVGPGGTSQSPTQFLTAANVTAAGVVAGVSPWQRVTAVSVCIVVRSLDNNRIADKSGSVRTYNDCRNSATATLPTDGYLYKSFGRVYAIRNNLNAVGNF